MLLPVRVDTLEVPHLLHKDEPFERRFTQLHCRLPSALHRRMLQYLHVNSTTRVNNARYSSP